MDTSITKRPVKPRIRKLGKGWACQCENTMSFAPTRAEAYRLWKSAGAEHG